MIKELIVCATRFGIQLTKRNSDFICLNKKDDISMTDYIFELEHLYRKMMEYEM